jgi:hypothetical protein
VGNRAKPDLAKQAGRTFVMGPNCLTTSSAALALQASLHQAEAWSCLTPTSSIDDLTDEEFQRKFHCSPQLGDGTQNKQ